jgi:hypothetical protein
LPKHPSSHWDFSHNPGIANFPLKPNKNRP